MNPKRPVKKGSKRLTKKGSSYRSFAKSPTSWQKNAKWYNKLVGTKGHFHHQTTIFPNALRLLDLKKGDRLLDLACGQGVLSSILPAFVSYVGVDASHSLIQIAKNNLNDDHKKFICADITKPLLFRDTKFTHIVSLLALHDLKEPLLVFKNVANLLETNGRFLFVINHPCFRIPRQSDWQIDEHHQIQYRRLSGYLSPKRVPLKVHPGKGEKSPIMMAFHRPLTLYFQWLREAGLVVERLEEWESKRNSTGPKAAMENKARREFPQFLALTCRVG